jgi:hypothetical protein
MNGHVIQLIADLDNGVGEIGNRIKFQELPALLRADILRDWIFLLEQEYEIATSNIFRKIKAEQSNTTPTVRFVD